MKRRKFMKGAGLLMSLIATPFSNEKEKVINKNKPSSCNTRFIKVNIAGEIRYMPIY